MSNAVYIQIRFINGSFLDYLKLLRGSRWSNRSVIIVNDVLGKEKKKITAAWFVVLPDISLNEVN